MPAISIMLKPASSLCNMRCKYCFYHDVAEKREVFSYGMMSDETARNAIRSAFELADGGSVYFAFQGGEPTLRGVEFFRNFVLCADELNIKNCKVYYAMQTNATLIDEEWAEFFKANSFLIGLSLDGNQDANRYRLDAELNYTFPAVMRASEILNRYSVEFNILSVMTARNSKKIETIYNFFKEQGFKYLQFIPCLRAFDDKSESELFMNVDEYGEYLIRLFNLYVKDYVRGDYVSVRQLDNMVKLYLGGVAEQCGVSGHCSHQFVVEGDGSVFPCDFYCLEKWRLGNINCDGFGVLARSVKAREFIRESFDIKAECRECGYFGLCRGGGCKRSREDRDYCEAYKRFFGACLPLFRVFLREKANACMSGS